MGRLRSLATPARPLCLGGIPSQSPSEGGCRGTECCPFFCSICRPQSGRVGNETMPFFLQLFQSKSKVGIPTLLPKTPIQAIFFIKNGPVSQLAKFGE